MKVEQMSLEKVVSATLSVKKGGHHDRQKNLAKGQGVLMCCPNVAPFAKETRRGLKWTR